MAFHTALTELTGVRYPIIQGAFAGFGKSDLAGPVSKAGALGIITAHCFKDPESLRADIRRAQDLTANPLAVNFSILPRLDLTCENYLPRVEAALAEGIKIIFTSAYDGSPIGKMVQQAGAVWIHKCATLRHALSTARKGADAIVIVGLEGTGYKSPEQNTTLINITALRRRTPTPLIAAGGIGDGRGLAAALAMGACGVYLGTAFMATQECRIPVGLKRKILEQDIMDKDYHDKILVPGAHDRGLHSMACAVLDSIPTAAELIERLVAEAEQAIAELSAITAK